jgi:RND superfamily putative drug exporter
MTAWLVLMASVATYAGLFGGELVNETKIPGSESQAATDLLTQKFPERSGDNAQIVFYTDGAMTDGEAKQTVAAASAAAAETPGVLGVGDPYAQEGGAISEDGHIAFVDVQFDSPAAEIDASVVEGMEDDVLEAVGDTSVQVEFGGPVVNGLISESHTSEMLGMVAAMIVLLIVLGSAVAMAIPITTALISVGLGMLLLTIGASFTEFNTVTPTLAVMIGLGVGIDYSLFIVTRFRQALAEGATPAEASIKATTTAGRAVIFAGLTVAVSISGLAVVGIPFVAKLGIGAAMTVVGAVLTAVTLLPAILAKVGHRINSLRLPGTGRKPAKTPSAAAETGAFAKWGRLVTRHPKLFAVAALAVVVTLAIPVADQRLGTADAGTDPANTTTRKSYDLLAEGFGPGFNGPLLVAVDQSKDPNATATLAKAFQETDGVAAVGEPMVNEAGDTAQIPVFLTTSPQSVETSDKLSEIRETVIPQALEGSQAKAYVGGTTASYEDIATKISERMPLFLLYVIGITCVILAMAFRSVVVAVKAALTTMLSAFAAFGALTAIFEWGSMNNLVGLDVTGPTESFIPIIVLSILFGLSMDYEVFLVSRIREEYVKSGDARGAVRTGVGAIGKVIVAAGIIMGVVFWAFVLGDDRTVKAFGVGLGVAILVDALIVRMTLVPAVMHLLGDKAWYMPRWLDRVLPRVTIEPAEEDEPQSYDGNDGTPADEPERELVGVS